MEKRIKAVSAIDHVNTDKLKEAPHETAGPVRPEILNAKAFEAGHDAMEKAIAERKALIRARFDEYVKTQKIIIQLGNELEEGDPGDPNEHPDSYIIARSTFDVEEAVSIAEKFDQIRDFERIKACCFADGMIDGIEMYLRNVAKLNEPLKNQKALFIGKSLLDHLKSKRAAM